MRGSSVAGSARGAQAPTQAWALVAGLWLSACGEPEPTSEPGDAESPARAVPAVVDAAAQGADASVLDPPPTSTPSASDAGQVQRLDAGRRLDAGGDAASAQDAAALRGDTGAASDAAADGASARIAKPSEFHCVNWADARDNFVNGVLQLSGLDTKSDSYASVETKTAQIVGEFHDKLGANTIRIPINEPTVASAWWDAYKAVFDASSAAGMNVIVSYWAYHNSKPDDEAAFKSMWEKVVAAYAGNDRVFFDIHNEPSGYGASWNDEAARWLTYFPALPRARVIVAGTGADDNVVPVGKDARFDGCILELHNYAFWHSDWNTREQWSDATARSLGAYVSRAFIGEWGAPMSTGLNYNTSSADGDNALSYLTATADFLHDHHMGSCYWPGLRDGDSYTLMKRGTGAGPITLSVVNASGRDRLRWAWNL